MPSLGDAYDEAADAWERRHLYLGAALLFVGAAIAAPGLARAATRVLRAAGFAPGTALTLGVAVAAIAVPLVGAALLGWLPTTPRLRTAAAAGLLLATAAVAVFIATAPSGGPTPTSVSPVVVATYAAGTLLALSSPVAAAGLAAGGDSTGRPSTTFVRDTQPARPGGQVPADGGEDEEQLAFLLDRDDE